MTRILIFLTLVVTLMFNGSAVAYLTDTNSHPVEDDGGTYDRDTWNPTNGSFPAVGSSYTDQIFSESVTRITNVYSSSGSFLSMQHQMDASGTRTFYQQSNGNVDIVNLSDGSSYRTDVPPHGFPSPKNVQWDPENSNVYWYTDGTDLKEVDISTNPVTVSTVKTFSSTIKFLGSTGDWVVQPHGVGDSSNRMFLLLMTVSSVDMLRIFELDKFDFYDGTSANTGGTFNWAGLSPQGDYIIRALNSGAQNFAKFYSVPLDKVNKVVGNGTDSQTGTLFWNLMCTDHGGIVTTTDNETYLLSGACALERWAYRVDVTLDQSSATLSQQASANTRLFQTNASGQTGNTHYSCATRNGNFLQNYCWASTEDLTETSTPITWYAYAQEILFIQVNDTPTVFRMLHHRSYPQSGHFTKQARINAYWEGDLALFSSSFGLSVDDYSDLYLIQWTH